MFGGGKSINTPITGINVTPLVDITLVLLIIFMVTAKLVVSRAMPMDIPKAATGAVVQEVFTIELFANGAVSILGTLVAQDDVILTHLHAMQGDKAQVRAVVRAEGTVPHSRVMNALDLLRQGGISQVAFAVVPRVAATDLARAKPYLTAVDTRSTTRP